MRARTERIAKALQVLNQEVGALGHFYVLLETIHAARGRFSESEMPAIEGIFQASWRALLIGLAGMLSTDQESITIRYLLDIANNHPYDFKNYPPEMVKDVVKRARSRLDALEDLEFRLRALRDRRLAHLDRKLVNDSSFLGDAEITMEDCIKILDTIEDAVGLFNEAFYGERPEFSAQRLELKSSLESLFHG